MGRAKAFYRDVLGLTVVEDHGGFVRFAGGFALHDGPVMEARLDLGSSGGDPYGRANVILYFESTDLEATFAAFAPHVDLVHPIRIESWGGRVFRLRDPDGHLVEIGEAG